MCTYILDTYICIYKNISRSALFSTSPLFLFKVLLYISFVQWNIGKTDNRQEAERNRKSELHFQKECCHSICNHSYSFMYCFYYYFFVFFLCFYRSFCFFICRLTQPTKQPSIIIINSYFSIQS